MFTKVRGSPQQVVSWRGLGPQRPNGWCLLTQFSKHVLEESRRSPTPWWASRLLGWPEHCACLS